jgi:hypothetical protein
MILPRFLLILLITASVIPISQVEAKELYDGGNYDLIISVGGSRDAFGSQTLFLRTEDIDLLINDFDRLQALVNSSIFPAIKDQFLRNEDAFGKDYVENIQVSYDMKEDSMDILINAHPHFSSCDTESCMHRTVKVEPAAEARMSIITHVYLFVSLYTSFESSREEYVDFLNLIQQHNHDRTQILASQAKQTLNDRRDELLGSAIQGAGSLAGKIPVERIVLRTLEDVVRVTVLFTPGYTTTQVKPIDEFKTGISMEVVPEFPVNMMVIAAIGLVGSLVALRFKAKLLRDR